MGLDSQNKKDALRGVFTRSASSYERIRYFPIFGEWLVEMTQISKGAKVLEKGFSASSDAFLLRLGASCSSTGFHPKIPFTYS